MSKMMAQGDLLIVPVTLSNGVAGCGDPELCGPRLANATTPSKVLMQGEKTGHAHELSSADVVEHFLETLRNSPTYLRTIVPKKNTKITHPEHGDIPLAKGQGYRLYSQRQVIGDESVPVLD